MKTKVNATCFFILSITVLFAFTSCVKTEDKEKTAVSGANDLSNHPVYSKYPFGQKDNIVDIGIQPIGVPIGVTGELIMRDKILRKALAEQGLELRFHLFLKGADLNFFLKRGDLEAGMGGDMPAVTMAAVSNILVTSLAKQGYTSFVTRKYMLMKELKGKRIGYPYGSNAHYSLLNAILSVGLNERDIQMVKLNVNEMPDALAEDRIDVFVAWEPISTLALAKYNDFVVIHRSLSTSYLYFDGALVERNLEAVRQIVASQIRSIIWVNQGSENLNNACRWKLETEQSFTGKKSILTEVQTAKLYLDGLMGISSVPLIPEQDLLKSGRLYKEFEFLRKLDKIPSSVNWERVYNSFDNRVLKHVAANSVKYMLDEFMYDTTGENIE